ncbi:unnamed protein product [Absidia cylindrospora]
MAKADSPSSPTEEHESMWSYLTNQLFNWNTINDVDQKGFFAKLIHLAKNEDYRNEETNDGTDFSPADEYRDELGLKAHFPVIMIPGISSSIIESWGTDEKFKNYYRKRIWGTYDMIQLIITNKSAWLELMKLDPTTGLDPEGIKLRAAEDTGFGPKFLKSFGYWL